MKFKKSICIVVLMSLGALAMNNVFAVTTDIIIAGQQSIKKVSGIVVDASGKPIVGATIKVEGSTIGTISGADGKFTLNASDESVLIISFIGYATQKIKTGSADSYEITLLEDSFLVEEVVVVGYGVQKKATLTGSIAALNGEEIIKSKNENIQNMLTGRVPGLRVVQYSSEPGAFNMEFNIRGMGNPLIIIDGIPRNNIERLDANDIESISVLKDASAAIYGVQAANGVILVTTKKGSNTDNKPTLSYNSSFTWQYTSGLPKTVDAVDFLIMSNEKGMNNSMGGAWAYPQEDIDAYTSGTKRSTDWWNAVIKEGAPQFSQNLNVSGGSEKTQYYVSIGNLYQDSFFRSGDYGYKRYNLRSNISSKITNDLTMTINLNGIMDDKEAASTSASDVIYAMWRQYPIASIYANDNEKYYARADNKDNPVQTSRISEVGYNSNFKKWFQSLAALEYKAPFLKGLSAKAQFSYDYNQTTRKVYEKAYSYYVYDSATDIYNSFTMNSPTTLTRGLTENTSTLYQFSLNYQNLFAQAHKIDAILLTEGVAKEGDGFYAKREYSINVDELFAGNQDNQIGNQNTNERYEYATRAYIGRVNYDYLRKYMIELSFRYDGSSRFASSKRWGFFPAISAGYRISEELFWKNNSFLKNIANFKIRASYGVMGDDKALYYQFLTGYSYPAYVSSASGSNIPGGYFFDGTYVNGIESMGIPNTEITWYESTTKNLGFDFGLGHELLSGSFDIFKRDRTGLLGTSETVLPGTVGADLPQENLNSDQALGFELELSHKNHIGDFFYDIKANISFARTKVNFWQQTKYRNSYLNWRHNTNDRYSNIWMGYSSGGQFQNWNEIAEFQYSTSRKLPGDYYYKDWNGDGFINSYDLHPIGYDSNPLLNFGIDINMTYRGFDLNLLFQGASMSNIEYSGILQEPFWGFQSAPITMFTDRWRPSDEMAYPYDEFASWTSGKYAGMGSSTPADGSETNMENSRYLRLKNMELGYTMSDKFGFFKKAGLQDFRVYVNAYNLLTFSPLNFVDPEHPSSNEYMYPLNKTISFGLNCKF